MFEVMNDDGLLGWGVGRSMDMDVVMAFSGDVRLLFHGNNL